VQSLALDLLISVECIDALKTIKEEKKIYIIEKDG